MSVIMERRGTTALTQIILRITPWEERCRLGLRRSQYAIPHNKAVVRAATPDRSTSRVRGSLRKVSTSHD